MSEESKFTQTKMDRSTLPADGAKVEFQTNKAEYLTGTFHEKEDLFLCSKDDFYYSREVVEWRNIEE